MDTSVAIFARNTNSTDSKRKDLVGALIVKVNFQNRSSIAITASFSLVASILVAGSIIFDTWQSSKRIYGRRLGYVVFDSREKMIIKEN